MSEGQKGKFIELEHREVSGKFSHLAKNQLEIKVWHKGQSATLCRVVRYQLNQVIMIQLMHESLDQEWLETEALFSFDFNNVHYFGTSFVEKREEGEGYWLVLKEPIYKMEKRSNERLLAYPHHQLYVYFKIQSNIDHSNIISLNRHQESNSIEFKKFNRLKNETALSYTDEQDELAGFRILDISGNGVSFLANEVEKNYFERFFINSETLDFIILIEGESISITNGKIVYIVDAVNPRADRVSSYKIGFTFDENQTLAEEVEELLKKSRSLGQWDKEFENTVD